MSIRHNAKRRTPRMKYLIVLASVFGFGLCELFPQAFVHNIPASQFPHYLTMAKAQLHGLKATDDIFVAKVTVQVKVSFKVLIYFCKICFLEII